ncbi:MAG: nucleotidyltransferase [Acidobacteria bacterium]|nr:nucleotidyltransferase [Acidobacteriota bacterium]
MFDHLLEQIANSLDAAGIPYMVVGGQAVLLYGEPRFTRDIDVTLGIGPERLDQVMSLVTHNGWHARAGVSPEFVSKSMVLPCEDPASGIRIDFIFSVSAYEQEALRRARKVRRGQAEVCYASAEDVVIHKMVAGRPRDLEDVRIILLKQPTMDAEYVRHWLGEFERGLGQSFLEPFEKLWSETHDPHCC